MPEAVLQAGGLRVDPLTERVLAFIEEDQDVTQFDLAFLLQDAFCVNDALPFVVGLA